MNAQRNIYPVPIELFVLSGQVYLNEPRHKSYRETLIRHIDEMRGRNS